MTITAPFRIGKFEKEIICIQRDKKEKQIKKKEKDKLEQEITQMGGFSDSQELPSQYHKDFKNKKQELTEVKELLKEINKRKHHIIELHIFNLDRNA